MPSRFRAVAWLHHACQARATPIVYGVGRSPAVAAVLLYETIGLLVPLIGGGIAYLLMRREFGPMKTVQEET